jgi:hypothetical protein
MRAPDSKGRSFLGARRSDPGAGGLTVVFDFNRLQSEYEVRFQVTRDFVHWRDYPVTPVLRESKGDRDVMEAFFPYSAFGNSPKGAVRARAVPAP